ncbi:MAG: dTDP-4-keto-6-deoxy-D-glucose epimerase [bacterium]|nr:dTDP-4-keto-6-deoxy-D-glucose epimerase [bacterium]
MIFHRLEIPGAYLLEPERSSDRSGFFTRGYCRRELERRDLDPAIVRCEVSINRQRGTVRGLHYQAAPYEEFQLVRCTAGSIFDVLVDLRPDSPAFKSHLSHELTADSRRSVYVPAGVGHGFQTLEDDTEVFLQKSELDHPDHARGVRWDDPALGIEWPRKITEIADGDLTFPDLEG